MEINFDYPLFQCVSSLPAIPPSLLYPADPLSPQLPKEYDSALELVCWMDIL